MCGCEQPIMKINQPTCLEVIITLSGGLGSPYSSIGQNYSTVARVSQTRAKLCYSISGINTVISYLLFVIVCVCERLSVCVWDSDRQAS